MPQRTFCLFGAVVVVASLAIPSRANAQGPGLPPNSAARPPVYSPYLNLTRSGNAAINYYGLVRPELDFRNAIQGLQTEFSSLNQASSTDLNAAPGTGHPVAFMNLSHYYPGLRSGNRGAMGTSTAAPARRSR